MFLETKTTTVTKSLQTYYIKEIEEAIIYV